MWVHGNWLTLLWFPGLFILFIYLTFESEKNFKHVFLRQKRNKLTKPYMSDYGKYPGNMTNYIECVFKLIFFKWIKNAIK